MGQSGLATGLAVYEEMEDIRRAWSQPAQYQDNLRQSVATALLFSEAVDLPLSDVQAAQRYGWKVARADAWPLVMHKERGLSHRPPLVWELELMEGCLRAIPEFIRRRPENDPTPEETKVVLASGELHLVLSWVQEDEGKQQAEKP
jgi:hypothetical protein